MEPKAQLQLIWLLDYFRSHPATVNRLKLRLIDLKMIGPGPEGLGKWRPPAVDVTERELATASAAWQAYREPTPEGCFALLGQDLSALLLLRPVLIDLLRELPSGSTGLGATEMRMLEMISRGYASTNALFHLRSLRQTRVYNEWEHGDLLEGHPNQNCEISKVLGIDIEDFRFAHLTQCFKQVSCHAPVLLPHQRPRTMPRSP